MGRPGSALDNAAIKSWHSTLEFEQRSREHFATRAQARTRIAASGSGVGCGPSSRESLLEPHRDQLLHQWHR